MLTPPDDLDPALLRATLLDHWRLDAGDLALAYLPVGFGSHHWSATAPDGRRWFVTGDDHRMVRRGTHLAPGPDDLDAALRTVTTLRQAGLAFAHGPLLAADGRAARRVKNTGWTVSVYDHLEAESLGDHGVIPPTDRPAVLRMLARLHAVSVAEAGAELRTFDFAIGDRAELEAALEDVDRPWGTGPLAEPARNLMALHADGIRQALRAHDARVSRVLADRSGWVITHGEPHGGNILRGPGGDLHLVDWDTAALGPPERDLAGIPGADASDDWSDYLEAGGTGTISPAMFRARGLWWDLNDLAEFVAWFRATHEETPEMIVAWEAISAVLPLAPRFFGTP
ncbi:MAG TPA: phosphotransferase [Thermomicrobiales bacterium]|jgi:aminoglycoside phosphotransferase (APT) family kinase protein|nr:phosphotransferase [Thermomicrobiales bacterium]